MYVGQLHICKWIFFNLTMIDTAYMNLIPSNSRNNLLTHKKAQEYIKLSNKRKQKKQQVWEYWYNT